MCMWLWPLTITIIMLLMFVCKNKCMQKWHLCGCGASSPCCPAQAPTSPGSCWTPSWSCGRIHHCGNILHQNCKCEIFMKQIECKLVQVLLNIAQLYFILSTLPNKLSWTQHEPLICMCPKLIGSFFNPGNVVLNRSPKTIWYMIVLTIVQLFQQKTMRWHCTDHSYNFTSYNSINTLLCFANLSAICRVSWIYSKVVNSWPCHNNA